MKLTTKEKDETLRLCGLPSYDEGRILHPYHTSKPDRDRFPLAPIVAAASDPACVLGDDSFVKCRMYDCEAAPCTSGTCTDVTRFPAVALEEYR